jgi:hypothetical protein
MSGGNKRLLQQPREIVDSDVIAWMKRVVGSLFDIACGVAFQRAARCAKSSDDLEPPEPIAKMLSNRFSLSVMKPVLPAPSASMNNGQL